MNHQPDYKQGQDEAISFALDSDFDAIKTSFSEGAPVDGKLDPRAALDNALEAEIAVDGEPAATDHFETHLPLAAANKIVDPD